MKFFSGIKNALSFKEPEEPNAFVFAENTREDYKGNESSEKDMASGKDYKNELVSKDIDTNRKVMAEIFGLPGNNDLVFRDLEINIGTTYKVIAVFFSSLVDKATLHNTVIDPLIKYNGLNDSKQDIADHIIKKVVTTNQANKVSRYGQAVDSIILGKTALLIENYNQIVIIDTIGWRGRNIEKPITENTVKGPHEAFNENYFTNIGLIRRMLPNHNLMNEVIYIGTEQRNNCSILYMKNIANPLLVDEVKRRVSSIKTDMIEDGSSLEQFIEDHPFMPLPQVIDTERPDSVIASLLAGRVALVLYNSPNIIIVPTTIWTLFHSPEDRYLRFGFGALLRLLRLFAAALTLLLPAFYIAITNFHQEMIPTDLLFAIAGAREKVPFPTIVEVLIMEVSFELIREAGIRIPGFIGPTLGIIGALILGQAAVAASIVSPILIIVVALTGIGSFAIPNYSFAFGIRLNRFVFILSASFLGLFGIELCLFTMLAFLCHMKSFGVPYLAPITPLVRTIKEAVTRFPLWNLERTPDFLNAKKNVRQPDISRGWVKSKPKGRRE